VARQIAATPFSEREHERFWSAGAWHTRYVLRARRELRGHRDCYVGRPGRLLRLYPTL